MWRPGVKGVRGRPSVCWKLESWRDAPPPPPCCFLLGVGSCESFCFPRNIIGVIRLTGDFLLALLENPVGFVSQPHDVELRGRFLPPPFTPSSPDILQLLFPLLHFNPPPPPLCVAGSPSRSPTERRRRWRRRSSTWSRSSPKPGWWTLT